MNKSSLRLLGVSLLGIGLIGGVPAAMAEPTVQNSQDGTTTYFPPSGTPATTGALPSSDAAKDAAATAPSSLPATAPSEAPADPAPSTAAVTPPASEAPAPAPASNVSQPTASPAPEVAPASAAPADTATQPKPEATPAVAAPVAPPVSPIVEAARTTLGDKSLAGRNNVGEDIAAARDFYNSRTEPVWVHDGAYTHKAKAVISTLRSADDWGLEPTDFPVPEIASGASPEAQGAAEAQLTLSALKYARFARGGRLDPVALSNILDMKPPVKDPKKVVSELASVAEPDAYLRGLNPKHVGFERLRQALLKARGPKQEEEAIDPALLIKLPDGKQFKPGAEDDQVALLRQRLKVPAANPADERVYDDELADAVRAFQKDNGFKANGVVNNRLRAALNKAGEPKKIDPKQHLDRLIVNMERWRWLPVDLGPFYVMNNIPEFTSEIWKGNELELKQKMIVGQPSWPTPVLASKMEFVIFHPSWGMPDGIKAKELLPRLRSASGGGTGIGFFDQLFGGGSSGGARVLEAYKLQVYYKGQPVNPDSVNWNTADVRDYSFTQPPGADNPLGLVKFRFPNRHDVYMHDTPERGLFGQSFRALSHGCMRVEEPRRTAEVLLAEDKGYSPEKVGQLWDSGANVTLTKEVPVYLVYFTARVDDDGRLQTYSDIYGHDGRIMSALRGRPVRYTAPEAIDPTESNASEVPSASNDRRGATTVGDAGSDSMMDSPPPSKKNKDAKKSASAKQKPQGKSTGGTIQDALSNIFLN
ncbi:murein L,D-transpeptidase [Hyphomicrobium sp. 99]|uniref:L,D-transpeptidase family protein n=1 Tax=Hyphomicrobium sp. 99 TaxID=1163419 RepID=UPI0005F85C0E|nr:L,D-transpeptidase family protein [Hyphomicrobium sp. 99]